MVYVAYCYVGGMGKNGKQGGRGSFFGVLLAGWGVCTFFEGKGPYGAYFGFFLCGGGRPQIHCGVV